MLRMPGMLGLFAVAIPVSLCLAPLPASVAADGNRLAYLDGPLDPYYPHRDFPKLITPQWVGEEGVECVVTLAIDDMRDPAKYEAFLRPILNRLKEIDGRAAVSIMACRVDPADPQLQAWLKEGLSIECHTYDHPCPMLQEGGLARAKETYDKCVDLMNEIPGNRPVAFRVPCCDSKNTPSPRFWAEIFNKTTPKGKFLQIDSSVFNIITSKDKKLPEEITKLPDGSERFRRYVPFENFVNTIEDYPYPYVIGGMCWEFPCVVPSDWSAQHVQRPNNPDTVRDWKLALDACVIKQGVFNLVFHPHGWIRNDQIVELIDHAVAKHGKKVKFLTFRECAERLNSLLKTAPDTLRPASDGKRLLIVDLNNDGFQDLLVAGPVREARNVCEIETSLWNPGGRSWSPSEEVHQSRFDASLPLSDSPRYLPLELAIARHHSPFPTASLPPGFLAAQMPPSGFLLRDLNGDGVCEALIAWPGRSGAFSWFSRTPGVGGWNKLPFSLPDGLSLADSQNRDTGLRLIDVNGDGKLDVLFSNHERYCLYLFKDITEGWAIKVFDVVRGKEDGATGGNEGYKVEGSKVPVIPPFVRADGTNNGAWFHSGALWLMNEDTWRLPDHVFKLTFKEMLAGRESGVGSRESGDGRQGAGDRGREEECCGQAEEGQGPTSHLQAQVQDRKSQVQYPASRQPPATSRSPSPQPLAPSATSGPQPLAPGPSNLSGPRFDELQMTPPLAPEEALKTMHVRPGMKIELVAAEPLVVDPVAFDWGPDGRLWVVEMRDYPSGMTWNKEGDPFGVPGGRVKVLTDTDGDGRYDKATIFLDEIPFPTGVKVWRNGILVTAAPEIFYAEDTSGDDKADKRIVLYQGFGEGNQQHRVNGLRWGLDNWLHVGNGDSGGVIRSVAALQSRGPWSRSAENVSRTAGNSDGTRRVPSSLNEINVNGRDLRIRPDTGDLDATSGNTQFGRECDDWGNWFGGNNSNPMWHYVLDDYYLRRNPHLTPPSVRKQVSVQPGTAPVFPKSQTLVRFNDFSMANRFTSACSPMIYRDELLGPEYYGNSFVCEPVHNLVHREIVEPQGATFTSKRAADEQTSEFLASEDHWFRPSMCRTGPDGALWVADMYRFVIEHPRWIPEAAQKKLDMRAGDDKGRIYRIYPEGKQPRPIARLAVLDTAGLVAALDSPNGPQRDLAHQMLLWRGDLAAIEPLRKFAAEARRPQVRLQALCVLAGFRVPGSGFGGGQRTSDRGQGTEDRAQVSDAVWDGALLKALADEHPAVRRHAVRLAESRLAASPELADAVVQLVQDDDPHVRMQVAYSLGEWRDPRAAEALARLLATAQQDRYLAAAALSSLNKQNIRQVLAYVVAAERRESLSALLEQLLAIAIAMESGDAVREAMDAVLLGQPQGVQLWKLHVLARFLEEIQRRKADITALVGGNALPALKELFAAARALARGEGSAGKSDPALRTAAIRLLGHDAEHRRADVALLQSLLDPRQPDAVQSAAASALAALRLADTPAMLLAGWSSYTPALRGQVLDLLAGREDWSLALLSAVESGQVSASQLDARRRQQFLDARSKAVRERAEKVLAGAVDPNRQRLVETYLAAALSASADAAKGKEVFAKRCANCHKLEGAGHAVGPDLAPLTSRGPEYLLTALLDPNRAVEDRYLEYVVLTTDGRQLAGMLLEETGASITLLAQEGKQAVIPRSDIELIKSSGKSLMPEGLERDVTPQEMADLLAYLHSTRPEPKRLPLNQPEIVRPVIENSIRLLATNARVYGPTIKMEETYRALGWWNSQEDHAAWTFEVPEGMAGEYRVSLDYSCADNAAGNTVIVEVGGQRLIGKVEGTGGWDAYRGWNLGTVTLPAGIGELVVRSDGPIKRALFDLRAVRLNLIRK